MVAGYLHCAGEQGRPAGWAPSTIHEILYRPLYRGLVVWNATRKRNSWGQIDPTARPESEWLSRSDASLRIVDDATWQAAHNPRLRGIRTRLAAAQGGRPTIHRDLDSKYLLVGHARCATCGGNLAVVSREHGRRRQHFYGCGASWKRGRTVCGNTLVMPIEVVDDAVLKALAGDVLRPAVVRAIIAAVFEALAPAAVASNVDGLRADLRALDEKIRNLTAAVEGGAAVAPLVTALQARQTEREGLLEAIAAADAVKARVQDREAIERKVLAQVERWRALLTEHVTDGRQLLREVLEGPLRFTPEGRAYRFEGDVVTGRLVAGMVGLPPFGTSPAGVEPAFRP